MIALCRNTRSIIPLYIGMIGILSFCQVTFAAEPEAKVEPVADQKMVGDVELNFQLVDRDYQYQIENRNDPFVPFFNGETSTKEPNPNDIVEPHGRLTGMQLFEPGQLSLVGLLKVNDRYIAMVEDYKGQGYTLEEGMKIGKRGTVKQILANKVLIEEIAVTRAGKELRSEIVMALRKEGEE